MSNELVTIAEFETAFEAETTKDYLEENDIKAVVVGEDLVSMVTSMVPVWIEVKVFAKDAEQARAVLNAHHPQSEDVKNDDGEDA